MDGALPTCSLDIAALQATSRADFLNMDAICGRLIPNRAEALRRRRALTSRAKLQLASNEVFGGPGVYVWVDLNAARANQALVYVGIAKFDPAQVNSRRRGQPIERRLLDYLTKEYSLLDPSIAAMQPDEAERLIRSRLALIHPARTLDKYTANHMKSYRMGRATSLYYSDARRIGDVETVETALILSANQFLAADVQLVNFAKIKVPPEQVPAKSWQEADLLIRSWGAAGLRPDVVEAWRRSITAMMAS